MQFRDITAYVWSLCYQRDHSLSMIPACRTLHPSIACAPRKRRDARNPIFLFRNRIVHFVFLYAGFPKRKSLFTISALMSLKPRVIYLCQSQEINFFLKMIDIGNIKATAAQFIDQVGLP